MEGLDEVPNILPGVNRAELNQTIENTENIRDLIRQVMAMIYTRENMPHGIQEFQPLERHFVERCCVFWDMQNPPQPPLTARDKWMAYSVMITDHCINYTRRHRPVQEVNDDGGIVGEEGAVGGGAVQQHAVVVEEVPLVAQEVVVESVDVVVAGDNGTAEVNDEHVTGDSGSMEASAEDVARVNGTGKEHVAVHNGSMEDVSVYDVVGDNVSIESTGRDASGEESQ